MSKNEVIELFGSSKNNDEIKNWNKKVKEQHCPYLDSRCIKIRKSTPSVSIGTCSVKYSCDEKDILICPFRLLEENQIFFDSLHLLTLHQPGNKLHIVPEVTIPGGHVDYFLVSAKEGKVEDFVGIELQTLDTTGTVWPARQRFLEELGVDTMDDAANSNKKFGMNWKMTAKTILVQLHHKISTFENINKHLLLITQAYLMDYMRENFNFNHLEDARLGDSMHFHSYTLDEEKDGVFKIDLKNRFSTDANGISTCLGLQADANVELKKIVKSLEAKISKKTLLKIQ
jgi:hypothetical protein